MTDVTTDDTTKIEFIDFHQPGLEDGDYRIKVEQYLENDSVVLGGDTPTLTTTQYFTVQGARFSLQPTDIYGVFPPDGSLGDNSVVMPHISLTRSTIPWERVADETDENPEKVPWLALLVFNSDEKPTPQVLTLADLGKSKESPYFPGIALETGQASTDSVTVIDVEKSLLKVLLPSVEELPFLCHVRQGKDDNGDVVGEELAVVLSKRLPAAGTESTVHLVSLEARYKDGSFKYNGADSDDLVRLVSLKNWSFSSVAETYSFKGLLEQTDLGTLRLPDVGNTDADAYLAMGYTACSHHLRQSEQTVSWYHGPLLAGENAVVDEDWVSETIPALASDALLHYDPNTGMFDASYAAAWEMGRLLALQNKQFSIPLYNWKRTLAKEMRGSDDNYTYLGLSSNVDQASELAESLLTWLGNLSLLKSVPFNYLVPDQAMLPQESIRFFHLDPHWQLSLLDGALSIGRSTTSDLELDEKAWETLSESQVGISGFLLRSQVVAGWPGLLVDGYDSAAQDDNKMDSSGLLPLLRMEWLSQNVLICLFEGDVQTVDIHLKPETLHFGVDSSSSGDGTYYKELRTAAGKEISDPTVQVDVGLDENRILDVTTLASNIATTIYSEEELSPEQFALQMIEGVECVRFINKEAS